MAERQYVAVRLGNRLYTYHNDGEHVAVGELVEVQLPRAVGRSNVRVEKVGFDKPPFETKACRKPPAEKPAAEEPAPAAASAATDDADMVDGNFN